METGEAIQELKQPGLDDKKPDGSQWMTVDTRS